MIIDVISRPSANHPSTINYQDLSVPSLMSYGKHEFSVVDLTMMSNLEIRIFNLLNFVISMTHLSRLFLARNYITSSTF